MSTTWSHTFQHLRSKVFGQHPPYDPKCEWCRRLMPNEHLLVSAGQGSNPDRSLSVRLADSVVVTRHLFRMGSVPAEHDDALRKVWLTPSLTVERYLDFLLSLHTFQNGSHVICLIDLPIDQPTGTWAEGSHTHTGDALLRNVQQNLKPGITLWLISRGEVPFREYVYMWSALSKNISAQRNTSHTWSNDAEVPRFVWWQNGPAWSDWLPWFMAARGRVTLHDIMIRFPQTKLYSNWPLSVQKTFLGF